MGNGFIPMKIIKEGGFLSQRSSLVDVAISQIGYKEYQGNNNMYGVWYGMNNQPWCDIFVSWCAHEAKIQELIPKSSYVPDRLTYYKQRNAYFKRGSYTPKPGDLVLFDFNNNGTPDHIGIVEKVQGNTLYTIEGNTTGSGESSNGDGVYRKSRSLTSSGVLGYCVPAYKEEEEVDIKDLEIKNKDTGKMVKVESINAEGNNYIKLRDVEKLFPVVIDWDGKNPTIEMNYKQ